MSKCRAVAVFMSGCLHLPTPLVIAMPYTHSEGAGIKPAMSRPALSPFVDPPLPAVPPADVDLMPPETELSQCSSGSPEDGAEMAACQLPLRIKDKPTTVIKPAGRGGPSSTAATPETLLQRSLVLPGGSRAREANAQKPAREPFRSIGQALSLEPNSLSIAREYTSSHRRTS